MDRPITIDGIPIKWGPVKRESTGDTMVDLMISYNDGKGGPSPVTQKRYRDKTQEEDEIKTMKRLAEKHNYEVKKNA